MTYHQSDAPAEAAGIMIQQAGATSALSVQVFMAGPQNEMTDDAEANANVTDQKQSSVALLERALIDFNGGFNGSIF